MYVVECAIYYWSTSNKRGTNTGKAWTIEMAATEVNLLQLPITFPLNKTDHNLSLCLTLCRVGCYHCTVWVGDKRSEGVYVRLWFMYCCVRVRRPSYQDHHLPIDIETLQQVEGPLCWPRDPWYISGTTEHTERGLEGFVAVGGRGRGGGGKLFIAPVLFIFIQRRVIHFVFHSPSL